MSKATEGGSWLIERHNRRPASRLCYSWGLASACIRSYSARACPAGACKTMAALHCQQ